jgi:hypothetical protein
MMCLGWSTQPTCGTGDAVPIATPQCTSISWFWLALAAIGVGAVLTKGGGGSTAATR